MLQLVILLRPLGDNRRRTHATSPVLLVVGRSVQQRMHITDGIHRVDDRNRPSIAASKPSRCTRAVPPCDHTDHRHNAHAPHKTRGINVYVSLIVGACACAACVYTDARIQHTGGCMCVLMCGTAAATVRER